MRRCAPRSAPEPILSELTGWRKNNTRSLLRFLFDLPQQAPDRKILEACEHVRVTRLHGLIERVGRLAEVSPDHTAQTASNRRSEMKWLLKQAAERDLVPLVFPLAWEEDSWTDACHECFPTKTEVPEGEHPVSAVMRDQARSFLFRLRDGLTAIRPEAACTYNTPAEVPVEVVDEVCDYYVQQGKGTVRRGILMAFSMMGKHVGVGYRAGNVERGSHLLGLPDDRVKVTGLDGLLRIIRHHEMLPEWEETIRWVWNFEICSPTEHLKGGMPDRRRTEPMSDGTMNHRAYAVRAFLGAARDELSMDLRTVTPAEVFGARFKEIALALHEAWRAREAKATPQLKAIILSAGLIADDLFRLEAGKRGQRVEPTQLDNGRKNPDSRKNTLLEMDRDQAAYFAAYNFSSVLAKTVDSALGGQSDGQTGSNSAKHFPEVWEATGPEYWFRIRDHIFIEIEGMKRGKRDNTVKYHTLVLVACILCFLLSTACRESELTHIRIGLQYRVGEWLGKPNRIIAIRAADRKNKKPVQVTLFDHIFPRWLEEEYLDRTRPFFIKRGIEAGKLFATEAEARAEYERRVDQARAEDEVYRDMPEHRVPVEMPGWTDHSWFFVDTYGQPYGCPEESRAGGDRNSRTLAARKNKMVALWARHTKRVAASLVASGGFEAVATGYGHHAPHSVRDNVGYAIRLIYGLTAAASVLGDREKTVEDFYSMMSSRNVDTGEFEHRFIPAFGTPRAGASAAVEAEPAPAPHKRKKARAALLPAPAEDATAKQVAALKMMKDAGLLDDDQLQAKIDEVLAKIALAA